MRHSRSRVVTGAIGFLFVGALAVTSPVFGHGGEDHGDGGKPAVTAASPATGFGAAGDWAEVVVTLAASGPTLLYLADADTNAPIRGAVIEVEASGDPSWQGKASASHEPGIYELAWSPADGQKADLSITVTAADKVDLILVSGVAAPIQVAPANATALSQVPWPMLVGGGTAVIVLLLLVGLRARRRAGTAAVLALLILPAIGSAANAHGGEDHGDADHGVVSAAVAHGNVVILPKASQFLLGIRTNRSESRQATESVRLVGRVVPDPAGYARVQSAQAARVVYDPAFPIPVPGQVVKRGQVVAVLEPNLSAFERSDKRAALYKVESEIALLERQLARWEQVRSMVVLKEVETARVQLDNLRKEKTQIMGTALGRDLVLAPVDGRVTDVHIVPGEVVAPDTVLVEIVDPARLRVEAVLHDLALADRLVRGRAETRLLPEQSFDLDLVGVSPRLDPNDHGVHALFAVMETRGKLRLGMPVDVFAETGVTRLKVSVPRQAVTEISGRTVVFVHTAPEAFEARPVTLGRTIGGWIEIDDGLQAGERVVSQGVAQLKAVR